MTPFFATTVMLVSFAALISLQSQPELCYFTASMLAITSSRTMALALAWKSIKWSVPFAIPLIGIHGILNPGFEATSSLFESIPIRQEGIGFALTISTRVWLITVVAASWTLIERDQLIDQLILWRIPRSLIIICAQAISTLDSIARQIRSVYIAQQARGISTGPGLLARLRALPTIVIPVVLSTLVDSHTRSQCLQSRGLGTGEICIRRLIKISPSDIFASMLCLLILITFIYRAIQ